jgi:hypothetical protein
MLISPAQAHMHFELLSSAGIFATITVGQPGTQGVVTGTHGIGVKTPKAAAVAAITSGLEGLLHMPNGIMLVIGAKSMMLAAGMLLLFTKLVGSTIKSDGATPNVHINCAPMVTCIPIYRAPSCATRRWRSIAS